MDSPAVGCAFVAVGVFILIGKPWAYLVGIVIAVLNGLLNFLWLPVSPIWAVVLIAFDVLVIWARQHPKSIFEPDGPELIRRLGTWAPRWISYAVAWPGEFGRPRSVGPP